MALATLCSKLRQSPEGKGLSFTAFIVDHGLRSGSDDEAHTVATYLKAIGASEKKNLLVCKYFEVLKRCRYALQHHHP